MSELSQNPVKTILETDFSTRVHELSEELCSFEEASKRVAEWRADDCFTVFNAGTYDILTLNHILGLIQCRIFGAMALHGIAEITSTEEQNALLDIAASGSVKLMVTLDTNQALEEGKSRVPHKGGAPKPTLDWSTRARMLALQSIPSSQDGIRRNAIDFITRHGPGCCGVCEDGSCNNEDNALMAAGLKPDLVVVSSGSTNTVQDLRDYKASGLMASTDIIVITESDNEYHDPFLRGAITTTNIVERIRS